MQNNDDSGFLNDRFEGYSAAPTDQLWDNIAESLEAKPKKKRGFVWWWIGTGLAAVLGLGYISVNQIWNADDTIEYLSRQSENDVSDQKVFIDHSTIFNLNDSTDDLVNTEHDVHRKDLVKTDISSMPTNTNPSNDQTINREEQVKNEEADLKKDPFSINNKMAIALMPIQKPELLAVSFPNNCCVFEPNLEKPKKATWEWGLSINSWHSFNTSASEDNTLVDTEIAEEFTDVSPTFSIRKNLGLRGYLGYHLNERFRLYTSLHFEGTRYRYSGLITGGFPSSEEVTSFYTNQVRQYSFGIPIGIEFDIIDRKKFSFAAGFDFLNEMTIHERYKPDYDGNYAGPEVSGNSSFFHYRAALGAHLNLNYHINSKLRLNLRPGFRSYFGGPSMETFILPNRRLWWGGSIGFIKSF